MITIARTHHATRTFRLSCGCLRDYPGMSSAREHEVLCVACNTPERTLYAYPEGTCGKECALPVPGSRERVHVRCTNRFCMGDHHDMLVKRKWKDPGRLKSGTEGQVR